MQNMSSVNTHAYLNPSLSYVSEGTFSDIMAQMFVFYLLGIFNL